MKYVNGFAGDFKFLCNFYDSPFESLGKEWPTVEHFFQAMKTEDEALQEEIRTAETPALAKKLGRAVTLRGDWEQVKASLMRRGVHAKFTQNDELAAKLLHTNDALLIEGNDWKDAIWGVPYSGVGENWLGEILMELREGMRHKLNMEPTWVASIIW